ncbi:hypothetical protein [Cognatiluteimonas telluris]|uniref:hypothetical protein n=1 Tax=Cognatiluteimonas telluris TaxID=1104775 RepID=UPI001409923B|nr:hypothetical protein [Lysobacter telluris]
MTAVRLSSHGDADAGTIGPLASTFGRSDTVYAQVDTSGSAASYSLYARWIAPGNLVLSDYGLHVGHPGTAHTVISLSKPDGWLPGAYRIELAINGKPQRTVVFQVR